MWLHWIERGRGYSLSSLPGCFDEAAASLERLLELARGLVPPPPRG